MVFTCSAGTAFAVLRSSSRRLSVKKWSASTASELDKSWSSKGSSSYSRCHQKQLQIPKIHGFIYDQVLVPSAASSTSAASSSQLIAGSVWPRHWMSSSANESNVENGDLVGEKPELEGSQAFQEVR